MKFTDIKTLEHLLKEYSYKSSGKPTPSGEQTIGKDNKDSITPKGDTKLIKDIEKDSSIKDLEGKELGKVVSTVGELPSKDGVVVQHNDKLQVFDSAIKI